MWVLVSDKPERETQPISQSHFLNYACYDYSHKQQILCLYAGKQRTVLFQELSVGRTYNLVNKGAGITSCILSNDYSLVFRRRNAFVLFCVLFLSVLLFLAKHGFFSVLAPGLTNSTLTIFTCSNPQHFLSDSCNCCAL